MESFITIPQLAKNYQVSTNKVRDLFKLNNIEPAERKKVIINGFSGWRYPIETELIIKNFVNARLNPLKVKKSYTNEEICKVLRLDSKHYLWNREIKDWSQIDWKKFEELKSSNN